MLDESALLLELDDVYWTEEGVLSVQIVFAAIAMLSALAYMIRMLRQTEGQDTETDWEIAAKAWDDLQMIPGDPAESPASASDSSAFALQARGVLTKLIVGAGLR